MEQTETSPVPKPPQNITTCVIRNKQIEEHLSKRSQRLLNFYLEISEFCLQFGQPKNTQNDTQKFATLVDNFIADPKIHEKPECQKQITQMYRCFDCLKGKDGVVCADCFDMQKHQGHTFIIIHGSDGFCDCGNANMFDPSNFCNKHTAYQSPHFDQKQLQMYQMELSVILSLGIAIYKREINLNCQTKRMLIFRVLKLFNNRIQQSEFYQQVVCDVLLHSLNSKLVESEVSCLEILIGEPWQFQTERQISNLLFQLCTSSNVIKKAVLLLLKSASMHNVNMEKKLYCFSQILYSFSCVEQNFDSLMSSQCIKYIRIPENSLIFEFNFKNKLLKQICWHYPQLFVKLMLLMFKEVPMTQWKCCSNLKGLPPAATQQLKRNNLYDIVEMFKLFTRNQVKQNYFKKVIAQAFDLMRKEDSMGQFGILFTLSFFWYCDQDIKMLYKLTVLELKQILYEQNCSEGIQNDIKNMVINCLFVQKSKIILPAVKYLLLNILSIIYHKMTQKNLIEQIHKHFLKKLKARSQINTFQELKYHMILLQQLCNLWMTKIFANQSDLIQKIVRIKHGSQCTKQEAYSMYRDLTVLYHEKEKKQFINIGLMCINNTSLLKSYIRSEFDFVKKQAKKYQLNYHINPYSELCYYDSIPVKIIRLRQLLLQKEKEIKIQIMKMQYCEQIIEVFHQIVKQYLSIKENSNSTQSTSSAQIYYQSMINVFYKIMVTLYTATCSSKIQKQLKEFNSISMKNLLSKFNQEMHFCIVNQMQKLEQSNNSLSASEKKKEQNRIKKQQKFNKIKAKRQEILKKIQIEHPVESQEQPHNACIICHKGQKQDHNLFYLCQVNYSDILTKNMLKEDRGILLFSTCGHLIHETCLAESLKNKLYDKSYNCFLCKKPSNMRIPFQIQANDDKKVREFCNDALTVVNLQRQEIKKNIEHIGLKYQKQKVSQIIQNFYLLKQDILAQQIQRSIIYQIYLYFLNHTKLFVHYMLPIMPNLIKILKLLLSKYNQIKFELFSHPTNTLINNIKNKLFDFIKQGHKQEPHKESQLINEGQTHLNLTQEEISKQITKLFLAIGGSKTILFKKVHNIQSFNFFKPPQDIKDFKKMVGRCPHCKKPTDDLLYCIICSHFSCTKCTEWSIHRQLQHWGTTIALSVKTGHLLYEALGMEWKQTVLYRDYVGDYYRGTYHEVPRQEYLLDNNRYEYSIEDLVLEKVEAKMQLMFDERRMQGL